MYKWDNAVLTRKGIALLAKLTSGHTLYLSRAVTGAGYVLPDVLKYQTGVTDEKQELSFAAQSYPSEGLCAVPVRLFNTGLSAGYTAKQIGIYATDPDEGDILFLISQADGGEGTVIPSETDMPGYSAEWTFYLQYGQADGVNVKVDPANMVNEEMVRVILEEHASDKNNPHGVTKEQLGLGNVDNTSDTNKYVAYAQRAGVADKSKYALTIRLDGGRTENTNQFTFDGSTSRTVNITPEKICAEPAIESTDYPGCYYRMVNGEQEWLNPPVISDVAYRTTERYLENAVYTKLMCFTVSGSTLYQTVKTLPHPEYNVIRFSAYTRENGEHRTLPFFEKDNGSISLEYDANIHGGNIRVYCSEVTTSTTFYIQIWYIDV